MADAAWKFVLSEHAPAMYNKYASLPMDPEDAKPRLERLHEAQAIQKTEDYQAFKKAYVAMTPGV